MSEYRQLKGVKTLLAICIADREETYHHWQVFSRGADGVCIEFDREQLLAAFDNAAGVTHRYVDYRQIATANSMQDVNLEILPFTKRWPYGDEKEYRAVYVNANEEIHAYPVPIPLSTIKRITLSPWLAEPLVESVKRTLKSLPGCDGLRIYRSTLIDNKQWQKLAHRAVPPPPAPG